jgi:hypothetical protein
MAKQPENRARLEGFLGNEDGIMAVVFALLLPVFVVVAALAIDMGYSYWKRNALQVDASVTSLAGAGYVLNDATVTQSGIWKYDLVDKNVDGLPDNDDSDADGVPDGAAVLLEAIYYSNENIDAAENALAVEDFRPGNWDPVNRIFTSAGTWDPISLLFDGSQQQEYDAATGIWTDVAGPAIAPFNAVIASTRRADGGPNSNPLPLFLAAAVGMPDININTTAIATIFPLEGNANACIIALDPDDTAAFHLRGTLEVFAEDCDIQVNSCPPDGSESVWNHGDTDVYLGLVEGEEGSGGSLIMCGWYRENGPVVVEGTVEQNVEDLPGDPVADALTEPTVGACDYTDYRWPDDGLVLQPGVYGGGVRAGSDGAGGIITFCGVEEVREDPDDPTSAIVCPGVAKGSAANTVTGGVSDYDSLYVIKDGHLEIPGNAGIVGRGVTFYLTDEDGAAAGDRALIDFKGTSSTFLDLSAPKPEYFPEDALASDTLSGVLFWHNCGGAKSEACEDLTHNLRGTPNDGMEGLIYIPDSHVYVRGTADATGGNSQCLVLIANTIELNGTTGLNVDNSCADYGGLDGIFVAELRLRLVH